MILEENAFVLNNFDITHTEKNEKNSVVFYYGNSFFDDEFYVIKRKKLSDYNDDISNKEQKMLQGCSHENLSKYVMSFYLNKSIYIFLTATHTTLQKSLPIKNQKKALNYFIQVCKAVKYLHDKNLVYGTFSTNQIFLNKSKIMLGTKHLYDINKHGAGKHFHSKRSFSQNDYYLPPEEVFSKQGDVWSLGILMHEILTGQLPYNSSGQFNILED